MFQDHRSTFVGYVIVSPPKNELKLESAATATWVEIKGWSKKTVFIVSECHLLSGWRTVLNLSIIKGNRISTRKCWERETAICNADGCNDTINLLSVYGDNIAVKSSASGCCSQVPFFVNPVGVWEIQYAVIEIIHRLRYTRCLHAEDDDTEYQRYLAVAIPEQMMKRTGGETPLPGGGRWLGEVRLRQTFDLHGYGYETVKPKPHTG
jgi:hypothetical protein